MIDLHSHLLPGVDDGAPDLATSLAMARVAVSDGIEVMACTPHIYPGLYENEGSAIRAAVAQLQMRLDEAGIALRLSHGADTHVAPDLVAGLRSGRVPTLNDSRYFLLEPPHHVAPPRLEETVFNLLTAGYVPVITHPERLSWIEGHYEVFVELARKGAWLQITAGSLTGRFGAGARYWAERLLDEGWVHILATDAHGVERRPPLLAEGQRAAEPWVGAEEAWRLVSTRPRGILENAGPDSLTAALGLVSPVADESAGWWRARKWFGRR
ncbi:CpsB/CapC family capsule biosynthesis tyrosine phosphatase [uncultured Thiodictyon sp.]|uniref:tyrosine-protein phosphatase n=1 Tax=uncultured Thiodictyon sp. TaxID=1846217 RepID=UPI0025F1596F|nr:CpsB/CapC family capsule biosynthesis tyrosine phosphatase [uncultured Thiodictyon sp.]